MWRKDLRALRLPCWHLAGCYLTCKQLALFGSMGAVTFYDFGYDVDGAATATKTAGLTYGCATALRGGYWPSEDVFPLALCRSFDNG